MYDLETDPSESNDIAALHPEMTARLAACILEAHVEP
jgi:hypothetical protein